MTSLSKFEKEGRIWFRGALSDTELSVLDAASARGSKAGKRLDGVSSLHAQLTEIKGLSNVISALDTCAKPVRVVAFNKSQDANWGVPWHQDRVISLSARHEVNGFNNWSNKAGTWHCEPPTDVLDQKLFARNHLDDTDGKNCAMRIALGSHKSGMAQSSEAEAKAKQYPEEICDARRGDVLILKMLTLHSSKPTKARKPRRVFRVDYASRLLPLPLQWAVQ